uniref:Uncharacterized protein n=1 Tax=Leptobrachium leishanense TaxID=445787 RepID=A0A8C5MUT0_9ANUR
MVPLIIILFYFILNMSSALPVNPKLMTPTHLMQSHIMQLQMQPYQILSKYLVFGDQLMQPRLPQTQVSPMYSPILGNLLAFPLGAPNTQMLPVMVARMGQQGLLSGSDSEEGILSGVLMVPVDQANVINVHHSGVRIIGQDSAVFMGQQDLNPVGQKHTNESPPTNHFPSGNDVPVLIPREGGRDDSPGASIMKPSDGSLLSTHIPPVGLRLTSANPTMKPELERSNIVEHDVTTDTENWVFCDSYLPDSHLQDMIRGDGYLPAQAPKYYFIDNEQDNQTEK